MEDMVMDTATDMAMEMNNLNGDNKMNKLYWLRVELDLLDHT